MAKAPKQVGWWQVAIGVVVVLWPLPVFAAERVALVVGNGAYKTVPELDNPPNDARAIEAVLKKLQFDVETVFDVDRATLEQALLRFSGRLEGSEVGLFYYAGHGLQINGHNYLVPIDARIDSEKSLPFATVDFDVVLQQMEAAAKVSLLFLDACRDNPMVKTLANRMGNRSSAVGRGFARPERQPEGALLVFSTQPGNVAEDGKGTRNSPFTAALVEFLPTPGLEARQIMTRVRERVKESTGGRQVPWDNSSLSRDFYFLAPTTINLVPSQVPSTIDPAVFELTFWQSIKDSRNPVDFTEYLGKYPNGQFVGLARNRLAELQKPTILPTQAAESTPSRAPTQADVPDLSLLSTGSVFRDCSDCPEMVVIPEGSFLMGSPTNEDGRFPEEGPQHPVTIGRGLAVGKFAVTFDEWDACVKGGGCNGYRPSDSGWGRGRRPVINVSWNDAQAYVQWLNGKARPNLTMSNGNVGPYRLLSESEWEYAARAGTTTAWYWGDKIGQGNANCGTCESPWDHKQTAPVGKFLPNQFGLYDMLGNVWQWVEDRYNSGYRGAPRNGDPWTAGDWQRVLRGGSWRDLDRYVRSASRYQRPENNRDFYTGFRVARIVTP